MKSVVNVILEFRGVGKILLINKTATNSAHSDWRSNKLCEYQQNFEVDSYETIYRQTDDLHPNMKKLLQVIF